MNMQGLNCSVIALLAVCSQFTDGYSVSTHTYTKTDNHKKYYKNATDYLHFTAIIAFVGGMM
jgi:hypothetical protein